MRTQVLWSLAAMTILCACGCKTAVTARVPNGPTLRVLTYNVNWGAPAMDQAVELIRHSNADIVCLQETTPEWESRLRASLRAEYPHAEFRSSRGRMGGGLGYLSRKRSTEVAYIPSETGWFDGWIRAFETPVGRLQILNVHLRPPVSDRGGWASGYFTTRDDRLVEISRFYELRNPRLPLFVAGDFNDGEDSRPVRFLEDQGLVNALPLFDRRTPTWKWKTSVVTLRRRMDHVFFPREFECVNAKVLPGGGSDHFPVAAEFTLAKAVVEAKAAP